MTSYDITSAIEGVKKLRGIMAKAIIKFLDSLRDFKDIVHQHVLAPIERRALRKLLIDSVHILYPNDDARYSIVSIDYAYTGSDVCLLNLYDLFTISEALSDLPMACITSIEGDTVYIRDKQTFLNEFKSNSAARYVSPDQDGV